jgi:DNA-binding HxlR family transcriptional regulator
LRDAFQGFTRFDEFQNSLGIASNILSRRLAHLTDAGMFERRLYNEHPPRYEYILTPKGRDFFPIVVAMFAWGSKHLAPEGKSIVLADRKNARMLDPIVVDARSKIPITLTNAVLLPGPRASAGMRRRLASIKALRPDTSSSPR